MRRMLKSRPLSESAVVQSETQWSMDDNFIGSPVWSRTILILTDDERSKRRRMAMALLDERYEGSHDWRTLYVSVAILKSILNLIGSQCRLWSIAEMLDRPCWWVTTWASVFRIRSSLCRTEVESPINIQDLLSPSDSRPLSKRSSCRHLRWFEGLMWRRIRIW